MYNYMYIQNGPSQMRCVVVFFVSIYMASPPASTQQKRSYIYTYIYNYNYIYI